MIITLTITRDYPALSVLLICVALNVRYDLHAFKLFGSLYKMKTQIIILTNYSVEKTVSNEFKFQERNEQHQSDFCYF